MVSERQQWQVLALVSGQPELIRPKLRSCSASLGRAYFVDESPSVPQNRVKSTDCANQMGRSCLLVVSANTHTDNAATKSQRT
jgi:hypothetical protein